MNPRRTDDARPVTIRLAGDVRELIRTLATNLTDREQRGVTAGQVVERPVRVLAKKEKLL